MSRVKEVIARLAKLPPDDDIVDVWWTGADVIQLANDMAIQVTEEQVTNIVAALEHNFDATIGIDWDVIGWAVKEEVRK